MRETYEGPDWKGQEAAQLALMDRAAMAATAEWMEGLRDELRDQVTAAGLGIRLANVWSGKVFPDRASSADAAAIVYVRSGRNRLGKAPDIINFFSAGETVVPLKGRFLAIPTDDTPKSRGGRPMTVAEVEQRFGRRLQFVDPAAGGFRTPSVRRAGVAFLVLKNLVVRKATQRWRNRSARETERGRRGEAVIMFILVRQVAGQKKLTPDQAFQRWVSAYPQLLERNYEAFEQAVRR